MVMPKRIYERGNLLIINGRYISNHFLDNEVHWFQMMMPESDWGMNEIKHSQPTVLCEMFRNKEIVSCARNFCLILKNICFLHKQILLSFSYLTWNIFTLFSNKEDNEAVSFKYTQAKQTAVTLFQLKPLCFAIPSWTSLKLLFFSHRSTSTYFNGKHDKTFRSFAYFFSWFIYKQKP